MEDLLDTAGQETVSENGLLLIKEIISKTKLIGSCVLYDCDGTLTEEAIDFEWALRVNGDYTGYEVSCNEICVAAEAVPVSQLLPFAGELDKALRDHYKGTAFGIILAIEQTGIVLRIHTHRAPEGLWLNENLDQYDTPLLYIL